MQSRNLQLPAADGERKFAIERIRSKASPYGPGRTLHKTAWGRNLRPVTFETRQSADYLAKQLTTFVNNPHVRFRAVPYNGEL